VSINLGAILCIECSGKHRGLGVHISKVRSLILDDLENETFSLLMCIGNENVNKIYEALAVNEPSDGNLKRATAKCDR
jgi:Arf-GAP/coiled-coil/ANK repeat/PH domain-containing protein